MITDELIHAFQEELGDLLESLDRCLLDLKERPDDAALIAQVFRDLHTIKGNAAMFGFADLSGFVHDFETAFDRIRSGAASVTPEVIRLALKARDMIPRLVEGRGDTVAERAEILAALAAEIMQGDSEGEAGDQAAAGQDAASVRNLRFRLPGPVFETGLRPELLLQELADLGATDIVADLEDLPELADLDPACCYISWSCRVPEGIGNAEIEDVFLFADAEWELSGADIAPVDNVIARAESPPQDPVRGEQPQARTAPAVVASASNAQATVRVPAPRLDALMDAVGELVIVEARLTELARQSRDPALLATAEQITRLAAGLRDTTMTLRMVPMKTLIGRFRRLVSEAADLLGKPVDFIVEGEETEFDKTLIEKLADPIVHLLRNAIDHGIEPPAERKGKSSTAVIRLTAEQSGAEILVRISDDGRGMSVSRIRAKAVSVGLIAPDAQLSEAQICNLIFEPGFSTAAEVTEISGRGVGMDVVRRTIEGLRGSIGLETQEGKGTTVTLRLPLTLAIIDGLLIEVMGERYTIPMESVQEIVELPQTKEKPRQGSEFLDIRGQFVPFIRLHSLLECQGEPAGRQNVVVITNGGEKVGLVVNRILGTNQVVIKQMSKLHRHAAVVSGASILGDGSVALILDMAQLIAAARRRGAFSDNGSEVAA